jgi:hypothetical protein
MEKNCIVSLTLVTYMDSGWYIFNVFIPSYFSASFPLHPLKSIIPYRFMSKGEKSQTGYSCIVLNHTQKEYNLHFLLEYTQRHKQYILEFQSHVAFIGKKHNAT